MESGSIWLLIFVPVCLCLSAFCAAFKTACERLSRPKLKNAADHKKNAARLYEATERLDALFAVLAVSDAVAKVSAAGVMSVAAYDLFGGVGVVLSLPLCAALLLVFCADWPAHAARRDAERCALSLFPIYRALSLLFTPARFLYVRFQTFVKKRYAREDDASITDSELITLIERAEVGGSIGIDEGELIRSAIEFNDLDAGEIYTPRVDVAAVGLETPLEEVRAMFRETGYSRLPVFGRGMDDIRGVLHEKDFYALLESGGSGLSKAMKPVTFIAKSVKISSLLRTLQKSQTHLAVVVDEFGGTMGIVTLEDILEELVGEIWDEHDHVVENFTRTEESRYIIACGAPFEDFCELFDLDIEAMGDSRVNTVSGWVISEFGRIPQEGDGFSYANLLITVTKSDFRRVHEIEVECVAPVDVRR